jgi:hypothetical protein
VAVTNLTHRDISSAYLQGRRLLRSWSKAPSQVTGSGIWYDLSMSPGNPVAQYYSGAVLTAAALKRSTDGGLDHGPDVAASGYKKYLHKFNLQSVAAAAAPLTVEVLDYLAFYAGIGMDAGVQSFTTGISVPRYPDGAGVQMMLVELFPYVGSCDVQVTYKNSAGVSGKVTPIVRLNTQTVFGTVASSASASTGVSGRFLPLANGDNGVQYPESIEILGAGDLGVLVLVLVKPVLTVLITETTAPTQLDTLLDIADMPEIKDDAYLNLICLPTGSLSGAAINGEIGTFWS